MRPAWERLTQVQPGRVERMYQDGEVGYEVVSVTLPSDLLDLVMRRVGANGLSAYIAQALWRQEPMAALVDLHRWTAAVLGRGPTDLESASWRPDPPAIMPPPRP
jgi:hypothetical protein